MCRPSQHWSLACLGSRQHVDKLDDFGAPAAPNFDAYDEQTAPVATTRCTFVPWHASKPSTLPSWCVRRSWQGAPWKWWRNDVDGQLRAMVEGKPDANTSMTLTSFTETARFRSRSFALKRTNAPASRQMHTIERSGPCALVFNKPDRGQTRCRPIVSNAAPREHVSFVTLSGKRNLSNTNVRNNSDCNWNSNPVGASDQSLPNSWARMGPKMRLVRST